MPPLWQFDQDLFKAIHVGLRREWLDPLMRGLSYSGLGYVQAVPLLLAGTMMWWPRSWRMAFTVLMAAVAYYVEKSPLAVVACGALAMVSVLIDMAVARCALVALVASGAVRIFLAQGVARPRPSGLGFADPLEALTAPTSFPSGHSTTTFAIVAVLCWRYARTEHAWVAWSALGWGALVGFSRVYVGVHYPLDVFGGALLGAAFGSACYWLWMRNGWMDQPETAETEG